MFAKKAVAPPSNFNFWIETSDDGQAFNSIANLTATLQAGGATNVNAQDFFFDLASKTVKANVTADANLYGDLFLSNLNILKVFAIGNINGLKYLYLNNNQIVDFNPTALPSGLQTLQLDSNQIVDFKPTIALPSSLTYLGLSTNQMTTAGYTASETWANNQPSFTNTNTCNVFFNNNIDSVSGTNLETILQSKNCTVQV